MKRFRRLVLAGSLSALVSVAGAVGAGAAPGSTASACPAGQVPATSFTDIAGDVHAGSIACIVWWDVASGTSATTFSPQVTLTRAQLASLLARVVRESGAPLPSQVPDAFVDDDGSVHESNLDLLVALGVIAPMGDRVSPGAPASRELMAEWLVRTYEYTSGTTLPAGPDAFVDDGASPYQSSIDKAAAVGFTGGVTPTTFEPTRSLPRDQMATFVARILDKLVEDGIVVPPDAMASPPGTGSEPPSTGSTPPPSPGSGPAGSPPPPPEFSVGAASAGTGQVRAQATGWTYLDLIVDGRYDSAAIDRNGDGWYDNVWTDSNGDRSYDVVMYDLEYDGLMEWIWYRLAGSGQAWSTDRNRDGYHEHFYFDIDGNGRYELERFDIDGDRFFEWQRSDLLGWDGIADTWSQVGVVRTDWATDRATDRATEDIMTKHIVTMNQLRIYGRSILGIG